MSSFYYIRRFVSLCSSGMRIINRKCLCIFRPGDNSLFSGHFTLMVLLCKFFPRGIIGQRLFGVNPENDKSFQVLIYL